MPGPSWTNLTQTPFPLQMSHFLELCPPFPAQSVHVLNRVTETYFTHPENTYYNVRSNFISLGLAFLGLLSASPKPKKPDF